MSKQSEAERQQAIADLRGMIKPGDTVFTILRHVSRSGMSRSISVLINGEGAPRDITWFVAKALVEKMDDRDGIKVGGCGMDMGYHLVYGLSRNLFPAFECIGERCPSNDHSNGDRDYTPGHRHSDGGYALRHRWL